MSPQTRSKRSTPSPRVARGAHKPLKPFTVDHFRHYARLLVLDSGANWEPEPFQLDFVADLFSGVPESWLIVPEGNGKTTLISGIALYHGDYTTDASVLMAASSRDQCGLLFGQAAGFVARTPGLQYDNASGKGRFRVFEGYRRITCVRTNGRIQVFAADDRTGDGVIPTLALLDELHRHKNLRLYRTWRGKLDKRNGQLVAISTAGEPGSEFETTRERARTESPNTKSLKGGRYLRCRSDLMVLHDHALREGDNPEDLKVVKQANPFSGVTATTLKRKRAAPSMTIGHWRRFVCNLATRTEAAAIGEEEWRSRETEEKPRRGDSCDAGLDLGWRWDTTAIVPLFTKEWGHLIGRARIITPQRDGNSLRPEVIYDAFEELNDEHPIARVVMDITAGEEVAAWLERELGVEVIEHSQKGIAKAEAAGKFMEGLRNDLLRHVHDPELARHVMNAVAYDLPDGQIKFVRPRSGSRTVKEEEQDRRVIDGLDAAAMVYHAASSPLEEYDGPLLEMLG